MRRPVKYKAKLAQRNRLITIIAASVLGVGVIGGAAVAIVRNVGNDTGDIPVYTDSDSIDTENRGTTADDSGTADTEQTTDESTSGAETETPAVTEAETDSKAETETTEAPGEDTVVTEAPDDTQNSGQTGSNTTETPVIDVETVRNYKGGYLDISAYPTAADLKNAAAALKADGYTAVMVELKYDNGKLSYKSAVAEAKEYGANPSVAALTLGDITSALHEAGLYITGRVCAFRDDLAAKGSSELALMNTAGFRYSDGASRWISVYSEAGQNYILSLLKEMKDAGVDEIMLRDYALPADAGTTAPKYDTSVSKTGTVEGFISRVKDTLSGTALNLEMEAVTIAAKKDETMGIACETLAKYTDSMTADITLSNLRDGMTIGGVTIADVDADPKKTVETVLSALDSGAFNIRPLLELTGDSAVDAAQIAAAQSKGYTAYQMTARVVNLNEK